MQPEGVLGLTLHWTLREQSRPKQSSRKGIEKTALEPRENVFLEVSNQGKGGRKIACSSRGK